MDRLTDLCEETPGDVHRSMMKEIRFDALDGLSDAAANKLSRFSGDSLTISVRNLSDSAAEILQSA